MHKSTVKFKNRESNCSDSSVKKIFSHFHSSEELALGFLPR